jgi:hypothetical protein
MRRLLAASVAAPALILAVPAWSQAYPEPQGYDQGYDQGYAPDDEPYAGDYDDPPAEPDYSQPYADDDDAYAGPMSDDDDGNNDYAAAPGDQGAPQYQPYESVPPSQTYPAPSRSYGYSYNTPRPAAPIESGVPSDLLDREDALEQRIRSGEARGLVPSFHVDNLLVQLDSIRAQQDQLAQRDGGLDQTTRTFIESRLDRLERNVTW